MNLGVDQRRVDCGTSGYHRPPFRLRIELHHFKQGDGLREALVRR